MARFTRSVPLLSWNLVSGPCPANPSSLALFALLMAVSPLAAAGHTPDQFPNVLVVPMGFDVDAATFLVGHLDVQQDLLRDVYLVGVQRFVMPRVSVVACPAQDGTQGVIPALQGIDDECRGGTRHDDAQIRFGPRTWLALAGNYTLRQPPNASLNLFVPDGPQDRPLWVSVPDRAGLQVSFPAGELRFASLRGFGEIIIEQRSGNTSYNGTGTYFLVLDGADADLVAQGFAAGLEDGVPFRLSPTSPERLRRVLDPYPVLDLQDAILGTDRREAVRNATVHFGVARTPHLLNGAAVGRLNGTLGASHLDGGEEAVARFGELDGTLTRDRLVVGGRPEIVLRESSVGLDGGPDERPLWGLAAMLWIVGGIAFFLGRSWRPPLGWKRAIEYVLITVLAVVWDLLVAQSVGTSALTLLGRTGEMSSFLRLAVFEAVAFALALVLFYVPLRTLGRRLLPGAFARAASAPAWVLFLLYIAFRPGDVIALGLLVARL